jgi:Zn-finger nucleic acid-binding protein
MLCPIDGSELKMSDREGIEIDYCPKCRGVWLDRGELDKIIDRSEGERRSQYDVSDQHDARRRRDNRNQNDDEDEGFISNIFGGFGRGDD